MTRRSIDIAGFEAKFQDNSDPWDYAGSPFEARKRRILIEACGSRHFGRGLELACANGATTKVLASRCLKLLAVDGSPSAVAAAQRQTSHLRHVEVRHAVLPRDLPTGSFDLIVISELLYYLPLQHLDAVLARSADALAPGGRVVCLHHVIPFDDVSYPPRLAQLRANRYFGGRFTPVLDDRHGRFQVSAFRRSLRA